MKKNYVNKLKKKINKKQIIKPLIKKNNIIKLYFYKYILNRWEQNIYIGRVIKIKQQQNLFSTSSLTIKKKLYGITLINNINLNSLNLIGIRILY